jgi:hypothetical protein
MSGDAVLEALARAGLSRPAGPRQVTAVTVTR